MGDHRTSVYLERDNTPPQRQISFGKLPVLADCPVPDNQKVLQDRCPKKNEHRKMSDILADYRLWRSQQQDRIGTHSPDCHMWPRHERCMIHRLAAEVERLREELRSELGNVKEIR